MSTVPAACAGEVAVICVELLTVKDADVPPKLTLVKAVLRFVPVIITLVPPVVGPEVGLMLVIAGVGVGVGVGVVALAETVKLSIELVPAASIAPPLIAV